MIQINKNEPFVILLDLDNTIQGNVLPQLQEYNLIEFLNSKSSNDSGSDPKSKFKKITQSKQYIINDFINGNLLRPHFKRFIEKMRKRFLNVEFFVYTASENRWANYIVKILEAAIKVKINKKVFTRDDCIIDERSGKIMKSITHITPELFAILRNKYKLTKVNNKFEFKHIFLIDNNYVLYEKESHYLIKCPDYNHSAIIDQLRCLKKEYIESNYQIIGKFLFDIEFSSMIHFYSFYYNLLKKQVDHYNNKVSDKYWKNQLRKFKKTYETI
jgi:hypothetical protein